MTATLPAERGAASDLSGIRDFPCEVCGAPSTGYLYTEGIAEHGDDLIEGVSVCELHIPAGLRDDT